jgi:hypothetical protein
MDNNGAKDGVAELGGHEFKIVKKGLDKTQVADFINELIRQRDELRSEHDELLKREKHMLSLTRLAERTVIEADKLTEEIEREAIEQAKAKAKIEVDKLTEETKREAIEQAKAGAEAIMAEAEEQSQEQTRQIYGQLLSQLESLKQQVVALEKESKHTVSQTMDKIKVAATEKQLPSTNVPAAPEISLESAKNKDTKPQELIQIIDLTNRIEMQEGAPVPASNQEPTTYEKEVELEILPPVNPMKIMEIMKYLDNLSEVLDTELIPRADKPSIIVSQREPMPLVDMLRGLPQVEHVKEPTDGEVAATGTDSAEDGKRKKIEITLSV